LLAHSLPVLLRQNGVDLALIGLLKLLALPWLLKALWAPWIDRMASRRLGHHRGWILPLQLTVIAIAFLAVGLWFGRKPWYRKAIAIPASLAWTCVYGNAFWVAASLAILL
jgi:membrane-bound metal-dependent hydrolase YbcI (DUF457 family)